MSYDPDSISDRMDYAEPKECRCGGSGWVSYERGNPHAVEPCGCDEVEPEPDDEDEAEESLFRSLVQEAE